MSVELWLTKNIDYATNQEIIEYNYINYNY